MSDEGCRLRISPSGRRTEDDTPPRWRAHTPADADPRHLPLLSGLPADVVNVASAAGDLSVGAGARYLFTWQAYRPEASWARWLFVAAVIVLATVALGMLPSSAIILLELNALGASPSQWPR